MKQYKLYYCLIFLLTLQPLYLKAQNVFTSRSITRSDVNGSRRLLLPVASFTCSDTIVCIDSCITVVNTTGGTLDSARWCVSGVLIPSPLTTTPLCFVSSGIYEVSLFVYNASGADTATISVTVNDPPTPTIAMAGDSLTVTTSYTGYQWYKNGSIIPGATSQKYLPIISGDYEVKVTDAGGCKGMSGMYTVLSTSSSLTNKNVTITVTPNPNQGRFTLSGSIASIKDKELQIDITDLTGRKVHSQTIAVNAGKINDEISTEKLVEGIYLLQYSNSDDVNGVMLIERR
jgi:hypothetical protein